MNLRNIRRMPPAPAQIEPNFDAAQLERDIREVVETRPLDEPLPEPEAQDFAPPMPLPSYVTPAPDISQAGRLTAQVVVQQYEATAKSIEEMANELIEMQKRIEQETQHVHKVAKDLRDLAQLARDEGKAAYERIENMARTTTEIGKVAEEMRLKLAPR